MFFVPFCILFAVVVVAVELHKHRGLDDAHFEVLKTTPFRNPKCFFNACVFMRRHCRCVAVNVALVIPLEMKRIINNWKRKMKIFLLAA